MEEEAIPQAKMEKEMSNELENPLPENIYSLMYTFPTQSVPYVFSLLVFAIQFFYHCADFV